jgi:addiction module RelE/StbE family toxin
MRLEWSPQARSDLEAIEDYIARDDPRAAAAWTERLIERAEKATATPRGGRMVPEWKDPEIREVLLRTYRIIYRIEADCLRILTVFEGHKRLKRPAK